MGYIERQLQAMTNEELLTWLDDVVAAIGGSSVPGMTGEQLAELRNVADALRAVPHSRRENAKALYRLAGGSDGAREDLIAKSRLNALEDIARILLERWGTPVRGPEGP